MNISRPCNRHTGGNLCSDIHLEKTKQQNDNYKTRYSFMKYEQTFFYFQSPGRGRSAMLRFSPLQSAQFQDS